jgi:hypothetical protein
MGGRFMNLLLAMLVVGVGVVLLVSILAVLAFLGAVVALLAAAGLLVAFIGRVLSPHPEAWELSRKN